MGGPNIAVRADDLRHNGQRRIQMRAKRDTWLKANRGRLEKENAVAIANELRRLGYYSPKTALIDIMVSVSKSAIRLGLPTKARIAMGFCR